MKSVNVLVIGLLILLVSCAENTEEQDVLINSEKADLESVTQSNCQIDTNSIVRIDNMMGNTLTYSAGYCHSNYGDTLITMFNPLEWRLGQIEKDTIAIFVQFPPAVVLDSITKSFYYKGKDCQNSGMQFNFIFHESTIPGQPQTSTFKYLIDKNEWEAQDYLLVSFNGYKKKGLINNNKTQPGTK